MRIYHGEEQVAEHRRIWDKQKVCFEPVHYLALLERKAGALDFALPLENWELPESFILLRRRLEAEHGSSGT
ncbi:IS21 family transposase, partial [bacterium]|nr:IS21 family transposase [bacterium]